MHSDNGTLSKTQGMTIQNMDNGLDGRTGTTRPARPTAIVIARAAPAKTAITRSGYVNHAYHLRTEHPTSAKALGSDHNPRSTHTHASCTHNDDVVDGSYEAASGHTCYYSNNKQTKNL